MFSKIGVSLLSATPPTWISNAYNAPLIGGICKALAGVLAKLWYTIYFGIIKIIAWVLDMLTQLFFIFSGMTPVSSTTPTGEDGSFQKVDLVKFFLTQKTFQKAYLYLCLIALGLIVVFAIAKIIKQDYFDRSGPRSKGPIFRSIMLSFIAFICIIPVFYFLIDAAAALALLVMNSMGYKSGGLGSMIFNMCWSDGGANIRSVAMAISDDGASLSGIHEVFSNVVGESLVASGEYDPDLFSWYSPHTFYVYYWSPNDLWSYKSSDLPATFYWYIFIFTGLILIVNVGKMLLGMITRLYNLIALFIIAPSPISQIVLDDGAMFKKWKDRTIQEALKVVSCVMCFMVFIMIVSVVNELDLMKYAFTADSASAGLLDSNSLTTELSYEINPLYYYGERKTLVDDAINILGRCLIIVSGVGAITDMDKIITPFLAGGDPNAVGAMAMGEAGKAGGKALGIAAKGALAVGRAGVNTAVAGASAAVGFGAKVGLAGLGMVNETIDSIKGAVSAGRNISNVESNSSDDAATTDGETPPGGDNGGGNEQATPTPGGNDNGGENEQATPTPGGDDNGGENEQATPTPGGDSQNDDEADDPLHDQRERANQSKEKLDQAKEELDAAKARDERKNAILDNMETIDGSKNMSDEEKKERLDKLDKEFNSIDAEGPSLHDAQAKFDSAQAAYQMDARELQDAEKSNDSSSGTEEASDQGGNVPNPGDTGNDTEGNEEAQNQDGGTPPGPGEDADDEESETTQGASNGDQSEGNDKPKNVRFDTMHHRSGELSKGAKVAKGALGVAGGALVGVGKLAFGATKEAAKIAGATLATSGKLVGTAVKGGASIAGIMAKSVLQMTGMGGVADVAAGFARDVKGDYAKFKEKNASKRAALKEKYVGQLKQFGGHVKSGAKGIANKVSNTNLGKKVSDLASRAAGYTSSAGGVLGVGFKLAAQRIDRNSRNRIVMDKDENENINNVVNDSANEVTHNTDTLGNSNATNIEVSQAANEMSNGAQGVMNDMKTMADMSEQYNEQDNPQLRTTDASSNAIAASDNFASAQEKIEELDGKEDSVANFRNSEKKKNRDTSKAHAARKTAIKNGNVKSIAYKHGIAQRQQELSSEYAGAIAAFEAYSNGTAAISEDDMNAYNEYVDKSQKLDNAYRHVDGDATVDAQTQAKFAADFESVKDEVAATKSYTNITNHDNGKGRHLSSGQMEKQTTELEKSYESDMASRASKCKGLADLTEQEALSEYGEAMSKCTVADTVAVRAHEFNRARKKYDSALSNGDTSSISKAREDLSFAGQGLSQSVNRARTEMADTGRMVVQSSKRNLTLNEGNARFEKARDTVKKNITRAKQGGASSQEVAEMEADYRSTMAEATRDGKKGKKNLYQDNSRRKVKVSGTKQMEKLAKKTTRAVRGATLVANDEVDGAESTVGRGIDYEVELNVIDGNNANKPYSEYGEINDAIVNGVNDSAMSKAFGAYRDMKSSTGDAKTNAMDRFVAALSSATLASYARDNIGDKLDERVSANTMTKSKQKEIMKRYDNATRGYNNSVHDMQEKIARYKDSDSKREKAKLAKEIEQSFKDAVSFSGDIKNIKIEVEDE